MERGAGWGGKGVGRGGFFLGGSRGKVGRGFFWGCFFFGGVFFGVFFRERGWDWGPGDWGTGEKRKDVFFLRRRGGRDKLKFGPLMGFSTPFFQKNLVLTPPSLVFLPPIPSVLFAVPTSPPPKSPFPKKSPLPFGPSPEKDSFLSLRTSPGPLIQ